MSDQWSLLYLYFTQVVSALRRDVAVISRKTIKNPKDLRRRILNYIAFNINALEHDQNSPR